MTHTSFQFSKSTLTTHQINQFLHLQARVRDSLSAQTRHYIKERVHARIADHLNAGMPILTLSDQGKMAGSVMVTYPDHTCAQFLEGYPFDAIDEPSNIAVIQSLYVDPDYRGKGLATKLIKCAADFALESGRTHLIAKAAKNNDKSQRAFLKNGFNVATNGVDPSLGHDIVYMRGETSSVLDVINAKELSRHGQTTLPTTHDRFTM